MADLFTDSRDALTIDDVRAFLCLDLPENQRPTESRRVDFKRDLPQDIGLDVAAMSNVEGGLIFVGVQADKKKQNTPVAADGALLGPDATARITDRILSTVTPRPDFDVVSCRSGPPAPGVVLIRVRPGPWPPYQYSQGATVMIPIRLVDTNRQATVAEIESFFSRRGELDKAPEQALARLDLAGFSCAPPSDPTTAASYVFHEMILLPRRPARLLLDQKLERDFKRAVREGFRPGFQFTQERRRNSYHEVELRTDHILLLWRMWRDGSVGFLRGCTWGNARPEPVGNLARDLIFFLRTAKTLLTNWGDWGPFVFHVDFYCPSRDLEASFPSPGGLEFTPGYDGVPGIYFDSASAQLQNQPVRLTLTEGVDWAQVDDANTLTTSVLVQQLREVAGARSDFDALLQSVARLAADRQLRYAC